MPIAIAKRLRRVLHSPAVGRVDFGDLRRLTPVGACGEARAAQAVDRYYIERFLAGHAKDIRGRVLSAADAALPPLTADRIVRCEPLRLDGLADGLADSGDRPAGAFDCILLPHVLHRASVLQAALRAIYRLLAPGGVLLATFPGVAQGYVGGPQENGGWRLTKAAAERLFAEAFPAAAISVVASGNVLAAVASLHRLPVSELSADEIARNDPAYPLVIGVRVQREDSGP